MDAPSSGTDPRAGQVFVALAAAAALLGYALPGGTYDLVARHQAAIALWFFLALGLALGVFARALPRGPGAVLAGLLLALAGLQALSATWSESADRSLIEAARTLHHLGVLLVACLALSRTTWRPAVAGMTAAAAVVCAIAVLSRLDPSADQLAAIAAGLPADRTSHPFDYWNAIGAWASMTGVLGLAWSCAARSRLAQTLALAIVPLATLTAYFTYSRMAAGALIIGALVLLVLSTRQFRMLLHIGVAAGAAALLIQTVRDQTPIAAGTGTGGAGAVAEMLVLATVVCAAVALATSWLPDRRVLRSTAARRGVVMGAILVAGVVAAILLPPIARDAWDDFRGGSVPISETDPSARLTSLGGNRYYLFESALNALEDHPAGGTGAGTFEFWWARGDNDETLRDAHSLVLESGAENGVLGLLLALALVAGFVTVAVIARFRRRSRRAAGMAAGVAAAAIVYAVAANVDWMWESTAVTVLVLALAGAVATSGQSREQPPALARRLPLAVLALVVAALQVPSLVSLSAQRDSQVGVRDGRLEAALADARRGERWAPWAADPALQTGYVEQALGRFAESRRTFTTAERREPTNWRIPLSIARLEVQAERPEAALAALRRARRLNPTAAFLRAPRTPPENGS